MGGLASIALTAALCGFASWLLGRRLVAWQGSSMLAETIQIHRMWLMVMGIFAALVQPLLLLSSGLLGPEDVGPVFFVSPVVLAAAPVVAVALLVGYFPARRQVFGDHWTAAGYIDHWLRVTLALAGPWLVLLFAPYLTHAAAGVGLLVGVVLCGLLLLWLRSYVSFVRRVLRAEPLGHDAVATRLSEIVERSELARVDVARMGPRDGRWAGVIGVFADQPLLLVSRTLLDSVDTDALVALLARDIGRMERAPRWRISVGMPLLVVVATLLEPLLALSVPAAAEVLRWAWPLLGVVAVVWMALRQGGFEAELDARAVELGAAGERGVEAVARGLRAVHEINLLPLSSSMQGAGLQMVGLEHRLALLRGTTVPAGDSDAPALTAATVMAPCLFRDSQEQGRALLVDQDGLRIVEGAAQLEQADPLAPDVAAICAAAGQVRRFPFANLMQLQFYPGRHGPEILVVERSALAHRIRIEEADVHRARQTLELAQDRLGAASGTVQAYALGAVAIGVAGICSFVVSWTGAIHGGAVLTLLSSAIVFLVGRRRTWLAACSAMSLAMTLGPWLSSYDLGYLGASDWLCFFAVFVGGACGLAVTVRSGSGERDGVPLLESGGRLFAPAVFLLLMTPLVLEVSFGPLATPITRLLAIARESRGAWVALVAAGAALAVHRGGLRRAVAALLVVAGFAPVWLGGDEVVASLGDPLAGDPGPPGVLREVDRPVLAEFELDGALHSWMLSPDGKWVGGSVEKDHGHHHHDQPKPAHEHEFLLSNGVAHARLQAVAARLVEGGGLLLVHRVGSALGLQMSRVEAPRQVDWTAPLPQRLASAHSLHLGAAPGGWYIAAESDERSDVVIVDAAGALVEQYEWRHGEGLQVHRIALPASRLLELNWGEEQRGAPMSLRRFAWIARPKYWPVQLRWLAAGAGVEASAESPPQPWSALAADCRAPSDGGARAACVAYGRDGAWLWPGGVPVADRAQSVRLPRVKQWDWSGTRAWVASADRLVEIDPTTGELLASRLPRSADWQTAVVARGDFVALAWPNGAATRVTVFGAGH